MNPPEQEQAVPELQALWEALQQCRAHVEPRSCRAELQVILDELQRLRAEIALLRSQLQIRWQDPASLLQPCTSSLPEQLVTLDQIGAMVHRSKRSMERYRGQMPPPRVSGHRGQANLWAWSQVRPWLEQKFGLQLPEEFPGSLR